ncbi:hypothetical protein V495_04894 [Pseudogymnoascus sp. VKM F-4514 (FW-929)]|nr:hypothetical protein V495_04894 [Pseudogymnoascus sp. VKM F-4514 (FW-929)]KFY54964.1 hypothetical protein V497_07315 [Pseudogymnoascus sp. VKM F-4516 (FW-969)]
MSANGAAPEQRKRLSDAIGMGSKDRDLVVGDPRKSLHDLRILSNTTTSRLDNTYYSVLEKLSVLQASIASLKELSLIARQLNEDFDDDSQTVATEIQEQIKAFGDFQAPQTKIEALQARIKTGREKVNKLGARVEVIRKRAEGWAKVEDQWQEKTRKRIKLFWALSATIVVVLVGLLIFQYTPARSPGPSIVDGLNPRAITAGMLDLERGLHGKIDDCGIYFRPGPRKAPGVVSGRHRCGDLLIDLLAWLSGGTALAGTGKAYLRRHPRKNALIDNTATYLKRELLSQQVTAEINELSSPTALQRFGAPFRSEFGEVSPLDSDLPILRYIFVHHVREFPFLDKAKEKEFWQDKLQVFLESFANKRISSSEDRLEETKRRKLSLKAQKVVELMMVSGIPTSSGYEERIRFAEMGVVESGAIEQGVLSTLPEGNYIHGWDVNVAGVRITSVKRNIRHHPHAEFILRVRKKGEMPYFTGRRYGDFLKLHKSLRTEFPGKILPEPPKKNKQNHTATNLFSSSKGDDSDSSSISSVSTKGTSVTDAAATTTASMRMLAVKGNHRQSSSGQTLGADSPRNSIDNRSLSNSINTSDNEHVVLHRESQRISLRAFLRTLLQNPEIARSRAIDEFLTHHHITPTDEDVADIDKRRLMDEKRLKEQKKFYEIARKRAAELDIYMEEFRRDIIETNGLTKLFKEIKVKESIQDMSLQYQKFCEWLRIEVAATIYHLFLAEDNSPEVFAQVKRAHSMIPYTLIKNAIRIANPAAVMSSILDIFLAQPFGARSLMQRIFSLMLNEGVKAYQKSIDSLIKNIDEPIFSDRLKTFTYANEEIKDMIRAESEADQVDLIVAILRSELIEPPLNGPQIGKIFNAYVAWNSAVDNVDEEMKQGAHLFSYLKQLLKLYTRQRDKSMMLGLIEEPVTLQLLRDLFTIFYEPLVRVYKSANVYNSVTDFSVFIDDMIQVVDKCHEQDISSDPNQTVQAFIDLCQRHEHKFYNFVHEVHLHDDGLFEKLMGWIEDILEFLRQGPKGGKLDINALFAGAASVNQVDPEKVKTEVDELIAWQEARKKWHHEKTRQKMAADGTGTKAEAVPGGIAFSSSDFGIDETDLEDMDYSDEDVEDEEDDDDELDPITAERKRRARRQDILRRTAGEPQKPEVSEVHKLQDNFVSMLRMVLSE